MRIKLILISLSLTFLSACGNNSKEEANKEEITQQQESEPTTEEVSPLVKYQSEIKESLFFHFRSP